MSKECNSLSLKRILTVDDVPTFTRLIQLCLETNGNYKVLAINESTEVLNAVHQFQPDLILLDIVMPLINGKEIAKVLRSDPVTKKTPIIFLSGYCPDSAEKGVLCEYDGDTFLSKPVFRDNLIQAVEEVFAKTA